MWVHGMPDDLRAALGKEGESYNERPHEASKNVCLNDVCAGRKDEVLERRAKIRLETIARVMRSVEFQRLLEVGAIVRQMERRTVRLRMKIVP